jgi:hypothetical protein
MVRAMVRMVRVAALAALVLSAQACARKPAERPEAAAAQALLASAWSEDAEKFEAVVDRPAVRADLRRQLMRVAQANHLAVEGGASDAALDRMINPQAFRLVAAGSGAPLAAPPTREQAAALLKPVGKDRVCLHDQTPQQDCLLTFAKAPSDAKAKPSWRLVGMAPAGFTIAVSPQPENTRS